jgi:hypothetical protein
VTTATTIVGLLLVGIGLALSFAGSRLKDRWARGGGLLAALTGFFMAFAALLGKADGSSPALSVALLLGAAGLFQILTRFEPGPPEP